MQITIATGNREGGRLVAVLIMVLFAQILSGEAQPKSQARSGNSPSEGTVIQGRITAMSGNIATVKIPDQYPGGPGIHAQVVIAGPALRVNVSQARILLADGKQLDKSPLAVGDHVLMVINGAPDSGPIPLNAPRRAPDVCSASIVERIVQSDRMVTH